MVLRIIASEQGTPISHSSSTGLLRKIRVRAAKEGTSVSALRAARLEEIVREPKRARWLGYAREWIYNDASLAPETNSTNARFLTEDVAEGQKYGPVQVVKPRAA